MALLQGVTNWLFRPSATADLSVTPNAQRMGKYNELATVPYYRDQYPSALEGSYFIASTAPGTARVATTSLTAFASGSTTPYATILNNNVAGGPNLELDYLKFILSALPTSATNMQIAVTLDLASQKNPTTAALTLTPVNVNPVAGVVSNAAIQIGAITTNADSAFAKTVYQDFMEPVVTATPAALAGDEFLVKFGPQGLPGSSANYQLAAGTPTLVKQVISMGPPIVITPGWAAVVKIWGTANAAAQSYFFEMGYRER